MKNSSDILKEGATNRKASGEGSQAENDTQEPQNEDKFDRAIATQVQYRKGNFNKRIPSTSYVHTSNEKGWGDVDIPNGIIFGCVVVALLAFAFVAGSNGESTVASASLPAAQLGTLEKGGKAWVSSNRLPRHSCPSKKCGEVGDIYFRQMVDISEIKDGWARISKYYSASCANNISEYVDSGDNSCTAKNGIVDGRFSEWVLLSKLTDIRPPDPAKRAKGLSILVSASDDFHLYEPQFTNAAVKLLNSGNCTKSEIKNHGGWIRSMKYKPRPIYFMYCGDQRIYLNISSGSIF